MNGTTSTAIPIITRGGSTFSHLTFSGEVTQPYEYVSKNKNIPPSPQCTVCALMKCWELLTTPYNVSK